MVSTRGVKFKFCEGERVLCYEPDPTKAKVLYESKVLEICVTKDGKKRKSVEYLVHFNGWSNTWDRFVPEEFILKDNDDNRALQRRLTEAAAIHLNVKKKKCRLPDIFKEVLNRKKINDAEADDWKGSEGTANQTSDSSTVSDSDVEEEEETKLINLEIPNALKKQLEEDHALVKVEQKLVKLPREPNVVGILEGYVKTYATNLLCSTPEKSRGNNAQVNSKRSINLCKEVMDGLRIYFDFSLPLILLFDEEKMQFEHFIAHFKPTCVNIEIKVSKMEHVEILQDKPLASNASTKHATAPLEVSHLTAKSGRSPQEPQLSPGLELSPRSCRSASGKTPKREHPDESSELEYPKRILRSSAVRHDTETKPETMEVCQVEDEQRSAVADCKGEKFCRGSRGHPPRHILCTSTRLRHRSGASSPTSASWSPVGLPGLDSLSQRVQPPPPLQLPSHISRSSSSSRSGPTTPTVPTSHGPIEATNALDEIISWQMIPQDVYKQIPPPPSLIYGAQHLLRLFVKLPEMVRKTNIADRRLDTLLLHLELFLKYLENRHADYFPSTAYEDSSEEFRVKPVVISCPASSETVVQK